MMRLGERILEDPATGQKILVALDAPQLASDGVWECSYEIRGVDAAPNVRRACGEDALQALSLALEAIRIDLRDSGRKLSWLGNEPGITGFHRVTYALGLQLVEKLESMIDAETEKYAQECIAGLHLASR
jgi:hypothetical protein